MDVGKVGISTGEIVGDEIGEGGNDAYINGLGSKSIG
jgi:hypothetical protein